MAQSWRPRRPLRRPPAATLTSALLLTLVPLFGAFLPVARAAAATSAFPTTSATTTPTPTESATTEPATTEPPRSTPTPVTTPPTMPVSPPSATVPGPPPSATGVRYVVALFGSDANPGTSAQPFRTLGRAFEALRPGDLLLVRGGTYPERIKNPHLTPGTFDHPITVLHYPGERPVLSGVLWLRGADYWTVEGLNVTWSSLDRHDEHMVKLSGGTGWRLTHAEIWGAHSYAAILVTGAAAGWMLDRLYVHDTYRSNDLNQDHLVYVNAGTGGGVIEHNIFARSPNGRGIKIGPPSGSDRLVGSVTVRYNTFLDNLGPSNIQLSYGATGNQIYRNLMIHSARGKANITTFNLVGQGNVVRDNLGWAATRVHDSAPGLIDGGGNIMTNPRLGSPRLRYEPVDTLATGYGRYAR